VVQPGGPMGQTRVDPVPRLRGRLAVVRGGGAGGDGGLGPGLGLGEAELRAVLRRAAALRVVDARRLRQPHHTVTANTADQLNGQIPQHPGQTGHVVAGVRHDDDVRFTRRPLPRRDEPFDNAAELGGGNRGGVVGRSQTDRVQDLRPRGGAHLQHGDERVRPAGDELRGRLRPSVDVAEQAVRRARRVRSQPRRHVDGQDQAPVREAGQRQASQRRPQPVNVDPALGSVLGRDQSSSFACTAGSGQVDLLG
jgi:hypothetical protein